MTSIDDPAHPASAGPAGAASESAGWAGENGTGENGTGGGPAGDNWIGENGTGGGPAGSVTGSGSNGVSRRGVLTVGAMGIAGIALAACSQAAAPDNPTVTDSAGGGGGAGSTKPLAQLSAIPVGEAVSATGPNGASLIIARPTSGTVAAFSAICTHQACTVVPAGKQLDCPCHGSVYNATTGAVINGPAPQPLHSVPVKLSGDNVLPA